MRKGTQISPCGFNIHLLNPQRTTSGVPIKGVLNTSIDRGIQGSLHAAVAQGITASELKACSNASNHISRQTMTTAGSFSLRRVP